MFLSVKFFFDSRESREAITETDIIKTSFLAQLKHFFEKAHQHGIQVLNLKVVDQTKISAFLLHRK